VQLSENDREDSVRIDIQPDPVFL